MYSLNRHISMQAGIVQRMQVELADQEVEDFINFSFSDEEPKSLRMRIIEIPAGSNTYGQPASVCLPDGLFHPHRSLALEKVIINSHFKVNHSLEHDKEYKLRGSFHSSRPNSNAIKTTVKIKHQPSSEGIARILQVLNTKLNQLKT